MKIDKEAFNLIYLLSLFFVGIFLFVVGIIIKSESINYIGLGLFGASLVIGVMETLSGKWNG